MLNTSISNIVQKCPAKPGVQAHFCTTHMPLKKGSIIKKVVQTGCRTNGTPWILACGQTVPRDFCTGGQTVPRQLIHRSIAGHNPYNLFILTIVYSKNLPTS